jgi:murein DD-endopeptidase MepM/ murein hydrolase activator NlpD
MKRIASLLGVALLAGACTQDPSEVSYRGDDYYGRVHEAALDSPNHETYPENSPRLKPAYARPVEPAAVQPVKITDLAAPTAPTPQPLQQTASLERSNLNSPPVPQHAPPAHSTARFIWPVEGGKVIAHFGPKGNGRSNDGVNIAIAEGEPIWAAAAGTVVYAGGDLKGYGNMVIVRHTGGWMTAYAHMRSISVKKGDVEKQGAILGYVGTTGGVKEPQLHFAIRDGRTPVDPELYLKKDTASE